MDNNIAEASLDQTSLKKSGMVVILGRANVGKSTFINRIVGEKISIVTPLPQTTRNLIRGIYTEERGQLTFIDTPGIHKPKNELGRVMNKLAEKSLKGADVVLLMLDASSIPETEDKELMKKVIEAYIIKDVRDIVFALNKIDISDKYIAEYETLWKQLLKEKYLDLSPLWVKISAVTGDGIELLLKILFDKVPFAPALFPDNIVSDYPRNFIIADIVREKLIGMLHQELPYSIAVEIDRVIDGEDGSMTVEGLVYVNKESQKPIVIGKKGRLLKKVEHLASEELSYIFERPVRVLLWVKVQKNWAKNFWILKRLGYV